MVSVKVTNVATLEVIFIEMTEDQSVRQLKAYIEGRGLGPVFRQRLAHAGRILSDEMTILSSGISNIPSVVLSVRNDSSDPTVGAASLTSGNRAEHVPVAAAFYTPAVENRTEEDESDQEYQEDVPTCRICHGMF